MNKLHVKRGDTVEVIAGKDKGRQGKVLKADIKNGRVMVEGIAMVKKHQKARVQGQQSEIVETEAFIDASNVLRVCPKCSKGVRTGVKVNDDGSKARYCKKCGHTFND